MSTSQMSRLGALAVVCLACTRPQATTEAPPSSAPSSVEVVRPGVSREDRIEQALARAPQLSRAAAELLADLSERRGGVWGDPVDASLIEANRGFAQMAPSDLSELGALFGEAYATLSAADRALVEGYVERVRRGDATDADERARTLLAQAVKSLPEARRARLQGLVQAAIRLGLETEVRTALAAQQAPVPPVPLTRPPAWARREADATTYQRQQNAAPARDHDAEDARLRSLGASYKIQIEGLENQIRYAERNVESAQRSVESARETPLNKRPMGDPSVNYAEKRLEEARAEVQRIRNQLDDVLTQVRRERIPQSYVQ
jgi:hypothetical protein